MATIKRNWKHVIVLLAILGLLASWEFIPAMLDRDGGGVTNALAQSAGEGEPEQPEPLDPVLLGEVTRARGALALSNQDLAAFGLDKDGATSVLGALVNWCDTNGQRIAAARQAVRTAERELQNALRQINVGPRDELLIASVAGLKDDVAAARTALENLYAEAVTPLNAQLTFDQQTRWQTARTNHDRPGGLRYAPNVTDAHAAAVRTARYTAARSGTSPDTAIDEALSYTQTQAIADARARATAAIEDVVKAEAAVLYGRSETD